MRKCIRSRSPTPTVSKAHNYFSRGDNLLNCVVLDTLECWLQDRVDRKSFHNVSNFAPNVNLPLAWSTTLIWHKTIIRHTRVPLLNIADCVELFLLQIIS